MPVYRKAPLCTSSPLIAGFASTVSSGFDGDARMPAKSTASGVAITQTRDEGQLTPAGWRLPKRCIPALIAFAQCQTYKPEKQRLQDGALLELSVCTVLSGMDIRLCINQLRGEGCLFLVKHSQINPNATDHSAANPIRYTSESRKVTVCAGPEPQQGIHALIHAFQFFSFPPGCHRDA